MTKNELCEELKSFFQDCETKRELINEINAQQVSNSSLRDSIGKLAERWFPYSKQLSTYSLPPEILDPYNQSFITLIKLSNKHNRKSSFLACFNQICKNYNNEIIFFLITKAEDITINNGEANLSYEAREMLKKISDQEENEYLTEALGCWESGFLKAAVVLLWCACIDRIHLIIEQHGFELFNATSAGMKLQKTGRFKKFDKTFSVHSLSELRTLFDSDLLWIIEGMGFIDCNQKARLASCFDMRCHSGHPGAAPITKYNVLSCFSDVIEIVLANPTFSINADGK